MACLKKITKLVLMIIWIASYPKSGNTWVRSLLTSYYFSNIDSRFPDLNKIPNFNVGDFINNSNLLKNNIDVAAHWIKVQNQIKKKYNKTFFFKTHNACISINNNNFTNSDNTRGCIYVLRDPRNVITSYKNFESKSYEEILKHITNKEAFLYSNKKFEDNFGFKGFEFISSWSSNYNSWVNNNLNIPVCLVRYEDLIKDTIHELERMVGFIAKIQNVKDFKFDINKGTNAVNNSDFKNLSNMENQNDLNIFPQELKKKNKKFFNLGKKNEWSKLLPQSIKDSIEKNFEIDMKALGYIR
tara:strand:+ start:112 stop:1008 length:897 start_codon:yes stop_codon:yes gene_type:complete